MTIFMFSNTFIVWSLCNLVVYVSAAPWNDLIHRYFSTTHCHYLPFYFICIILYVMLSTICIFFIHFFGLLKVYFETMHTYITGKLNINISTMKMLLLFSFHKQLQCKKKRIFIFEIFIKQTINLITKLNSILKIFVDQ